MAGVSGTVLAQNFLDKLVSCTNFKVVENGNPCLIENDETQFYLFFRNISWKGNPFPEDDLRAQLPQIDKFEDIKESPIPFLFLGYYEDEDVYVCWQPDILKQKLNAKSYVSLYVKKPVLKNIPNNEIRLSCIQDSYDYVVFKASDIALFFKLNHFLPYYNKLNASPKVNISHIKEPLQQIYFGAPGTGKSHEIKKAVKTHKSFRITFHPDTDYSSFVGAYKPTSVEVPMLTTLGDKAIPMKDVDGNPLSENKIIYTYVKQAFLNAYIEAWKEQENETPSPVFLVIEEINRGNCAQIFGDIFQLLDRNDAGFSDYSIVPDSDLSRHVSKDLMGLNIANREKINAIYEECEADMVGKVLRGDVLLLPNNLYIWATMNTSDQSLFPIDSAFKRRWDWKYIKIANAHKNWQIKVGTETFDWWQFVQAINYFVFDTTQSEDKNLGYFFAKAKDEKGITAETFVSKVIFYLYTDVFKDYGFSGDIFKGENDEEMTFQSFYTNDGKPCEAQIIRFIKNVIYSDALPETLKAVEPADDEETGYSSIQVNVNGKIETSMTQTVISILRHIANKYSIEEIEVAVKENINRPDTPTIKRIENPESYIKENRWNPTILKSSDGVAFVVTTMWQRQYLPMIENLAKYFNIPFEVVNP